MLHSKGIPIDFQLALLCLAAAVAAEPEADAYVLYGHPGYGYGYNNYGYNAYGYGYPRTYGYGAHYIGKREAEPSVAAYVAAPYAYSPYTYAYAPVASSYQNVATPAAAYGIHQIHKRQGVAVHPGFATSSTYRSVQGAPALYPYAPYYRPYGVYGYGY